MVAIAVSEPSTSVPHASTEPAGAMGVAAAFAAAVPPCHAPPRLSWLWALPPWQPTQ